MDLEANFLLNLGFYIEFHNGDQQKITRRKCFFWKNYMKGEPSIGLKNGRKPTAIRVGSVCVNIEHDCIITKDRPNHTLKIIKCRVLDGVWNKLRPLVSK